MSAARILLVEDEPGIADAIEYALRTEGFECDWHSTGAAALEAFSTSTYELAILDIGLPDMSGFDLCRHLREQADTPIIFLSARDTELDKVLGLELGADDYVTKPFSPRELTARVRARLRRHRPAKTAAALLLDEAAMQASWDGVVLSLTRYEFRLLRVLFSQPGRVFSREQLLEQVWSDPTAAFDRTVDTHIKTLRQKLREVRPNAHPVKTHRGSGYSWDANALR